ncbi:HPr kinase/phosphatase C-terminal domain-containing protein [Pseudaestuariivita rosea]|uniref:HPr kinase/phosphorylase n=1 Tax=Pseudaestuariivita rosea TaxID=2763263 RepID=UPI00301351AD
MTAKTDIVYRGSSVAVNEKALLITGASGAGKSTLALQMITQGATLIADDYTALRTNGRDLIASAPDPIRGSIEVRGLGLLSAETIGSARVVAVIDLDQTETQRLPPARHIDILGTTIDCLHKIEGPHFPAALLQYLKFGRQNQDTE